MPLGFISQLLKPKAGFGKPVGGIPQAKAVGWLSRLLGGVLRRKVPQALVAVTPEPTTAQDDEWGPDWLEYTPEAEARMGKPPTEFPPEIAELDQWQVMASSNVDKMRYLPAERTLMVEFKSGALYEYYDVPAEIALMFSKAGSPGRFVWSNLRDVYDYRRLTDPYKKTDPYPRTATVIRTRHDLIPRWARKLKEYHGPSLSKPDPLRPLPPR